jgi:hypothetical protein
MKLISRLLKKEQSAVKVLRFVSNLTDYTFLEKFVFKNKNVDVAEEKSRQNRLALFLLQELARNPCGSVNEIPPALNQLTLNLEDKARVPKLLALAKKCLKVRPVSTICIFLTPVVRDRQSNAQTAREVKHSLADQPSRC